MPTFSTNTMPVVYSASLETIKCNARDLIIRLTQYPLYKENAHPIGRVVFTLSHTQGAVQKEQRFDENYLHVEAHEGDLLVVTVFDEQTGARKGVACYEVSLKGEGQLIPLSSVGGIQFALYYSPNPWKTQELRETLLREPALCAIMDHLLEGRNAVRGLYDYIAVGNLPKSFYEAIEVPSNEADRLRNCIDYEEIVSNWEENKARYITNQLQ